MVISTELITLISALILVAAAIYVRHIRKKTKETNIKVENALQEIAEFKKHFDDFKKMTLDFHERTNMDDVMREIAEFKKAANNFEKLISDLNNKTKDLSRSVGQIHLASLEECK